MTLIWKPAIADALARDLERLAGDDHDIYWLRVAEQLVDLGWRLDGDA